MADIVLAGNANWSTCKAGGAPAAGDTIYLNGYTLTLNLGNGATYTCVAIKGQTGAGAPAAGTIAPGTSTPFTLACDLYGSTSSVMLTLASGKVLSSVGNVYAGNGSKCISNAGTITSVASANGGTANSTYAIWNTGSIGTVGSVVGGSGIQSMGLDNESGATITSIGTATGGSGSAVCFGVHNYRGTITSITSAIGGSGGTQNVGVYNNTSSTITTITSGVGSAVSANNAIENWGTIGTLTSITGGSFPGAFGINNNSNSTITALVAASGGSAANTYGVKNLASGIITTLSSATGGSASGAYGCHNAGTITNPIGNAKGGSNSTAYGYAHAGSSAVSFTAVDNTGVAPPVGVFGLSVPAGAFVGMGSSVFIDAATVVSAASVVVGNYNYTGGAAGTYPTTTTSKAEQLAEDKAAVSAAAANIKNNATILTINGTYDYQGAIDSAVAEQLAADKAEVESNKSSIKSACILLGVGGTLDMSLYTLISGVVGASYVVVGHDNYSGGEHGTYPTTETSKAEQLADDKAAVTAAAASIKNDTAILTIDGAYDFAAAIAEGYSNGEADQLATDVAAVEEAKGDILDTRTLLGVTGTHETGSPLTGAPTLTATVLSATLVRLTVALPEHAATCSILRRTIGGGFLVRTTLTIGGSFDDAVSAGEFYEYIAVAVNADGTSARASRPVFVRASLAVDPILSQIADAIVQELNDHAFSRSFTAERLYAPHYELKDMGALHVSVVPRSIESTTVARFCSRFDCVVDIAVQQKITTGDGEQSECDALAELVREIAAFFRRRRPVAFPRAMWLKEENDPVCLPEHIEQMHQFTGVLRLTYVVAE